MAPYLLLLEKNISVPGKKKIKILWKQNRVSATTAIVGSQTSVLRYWRALGFPSGKKYHRTCHQAVSIALWEGKRGACQQALSSTRDCKGWNHWAGRSQVAVPGCRISTTAEGDQAEKQGIELASLHPVLFHGRYVPHEQRQPGKGRENSSFHKTTVIILYC